MECSLDIGDNRNFELKRALLVYTDNNRSGGSAQATAFATVHQVVTNPSGAPTLGSGQAVTSDFLATLADGLFANSAIALLPENILVSTHNTLVWWVRPRLAPMHFREGENPQLKGLSGRLFPQPALVFKAHPHQLSVRALSKAVRPGLTTPLYVAPYWNVDERGSICLGTAPAPLQFSVSAIVDWERIFWESSFTHPNGAQRLTKHAGGFPALWRSLKGAAAFPTQTLVKSADTLGDWIRR